MEAMTASPCFCCSHTVWAQLALIGLQVRWWEAYNCAGDTLHTPKQSADNKCKEHMLGACPHSHDHAHKLRGCHTLVHPFNLFAFCAQISWPAPQSRPSKVSTCPALTRLVATAGFESVLSKHASSLRSAARSGEGKGCLRRWGIEDVDADELREMLNSAAARYDVLDSMSDDDGE